MIGTLILDKPEGITSHTAVARIRRAAGTRRVGHAGTLDPFATGVLVVCIGRATRLVQFLVGLEKEYLATVRLGFATDTQDLTGKQITPLVSSNDTSKDDIRRALNEFKGEYLQAPPMFSAKKIKGERLYRAARAGRAVERQPVPVTIHSIEMIEVEDEAIRLNEDGTRDFVMRVRCSSGTYIRTLAHDIGLKLGVGAHLSALRRTSVGRFDIAAALSLEEAQRIAEASTLEHALLTPSATLAHLPAVRLDAERVGRIANGRKIELLATEAETLIAAGPVRLCDEQGELVAVGECDARRGEARPRVVIAAGE